MAIEKSEQKDFVSQMTDLIKNMGAKENVDTFLGYSFTFVSTKCGPYHVCVYSGSSKNSLGWIAGRFDNLELSSNLLGKTLNNSNNFNPFSGKWNHHYFDNWTTKLAIEDFRNKLNKIL